MKSWLNQPIPQLKDSLTQSDRYLSHWSDQIRGVTFHLLLDFLRLKTTDKHVYKRITSRTKTPL